MFYAHSGHEDDKSDWQPLDGHLLAVATLAGEMAKSFGLQKAAFYAGLFHDLGKYTAAFQRRLAGADIRVDHSTAGARHILETVTGSDRVMAELLAYGGVDRNRAKWTGCKVTRLSPPARRRGSKLDDWHSVQFFGIMEQVPQSRRAIA